MCEENGIFKYYYKTINVITFISSSQSTKVWRAGQLPPRARLPSRRYLRLRARTQISSRPITRTHHGKERDQLRGVFLGERLVSIVSRTTRPVSFLLRDLYYAACRRGDAYSASPVSRNHSIYGVTTRRRRTFRFERGSEPAEPETTYFISPDFSRRSTVSQTLATPGSFTSMHHRRDGKRMVLQSLKANLRCLNSSCTNSGCGFCGKTLLHA